ncbi:MAG: MalY/PatB family protein [Propioniciclava sp.]|uniref:MalY/PatB family protein n=1 Tax=Propioniciclava sp. TaxID=2038686 RepID=UPI0039E36550
MPSEFDEAPDRFGTNSMKWQVGEGELPMWVADMDFRTAPVIMDALRRTVDHGVLGYTIVPRAYGRAVASWWRNRHGWDIDERWIALTTGVVPAISSMVRTLTQPGDQVAVLTPVYNIFFNCIRNSGRVPVSSPLVTRDDGDEVNWAGLEGVLAQPRTTLLLLCNPQNPTGTIWSARMLARLGALCATHGVRVISDEVHGDLTAPGTRYIPFATASATCERIGVTCLAPTKAFNIAGLQTAAIVAADPELRASVVRGINRDEVAEPNAFAVAATIAAFEHGSPWLDELRAYLFANKAHAAASVSAIPGLSALATPATYLLWIKATGFGLTGIELAEAIRRHSGLVLSDGEAYGAGPGTYLRMNVACPRRRLDEGLARLRRAVDAIPRP